MNIPGISAYYHDNAACLLRDGEIVAAAQEERFSRRERSEPTPNYACVCCDRRLSTGGQFHIQCSDKLPSATRLDRGADAS